MHITLLAAAACFFSLMMAGCGHPDTRALKLLACQQAAASFDMQSVAQLDALRKALGLAPDVDPIGFCNSMGVKLVPAPARSQFSAESSKDEEVPEAGQKSDPQE